MRKHVTSKSWSPAHIERLRELVLAGASPVRVAAYLHRSMTSVQSQAKRLGCPFPDSRPVKRARRGKEAAVRKDPGLPR
jgi:hypothetical protein